MPKQLPRLDKCLNCGTEVHGNFCSNCGQEAEDQTVAFRLLISDVAAEIASFDSNPAYFNLSARSAARRPETMTLPA